MADGSVERKLTFVTQFSVPCYIYVTSVLQILLLILSYKCIIQFGLQFKLFFSLSLRVEGEAF